MKNYQQINDKWICNECNREFNSKQATTSHIYRVHTNPGVSFGGHQIGKPAWNKGLTQKDVPSLARPKQRGKNLDPPLPGIPKKLKEKLVNS